MVCSKRIVRSEAAAVQKAKILQTRNRLDAPGVALLAAVLGLGFAISVAHASAANENKSGTQSTVNSSAATEHIILDKKFKGKLPISELTEDEAILHAMNRLAYGPRPGDVEQVRRMGLEKWIEQQLHPETINDADLNLRLERYPTLAMSSKRLLEEFPHPDQNAKQQGLSKEQAKQQGPNRIVAELSMAKVDRAVYSNRQLEAVLEDFWFNHFNVFANKGDGKWFLTAYERDTIRPHAMGKFSELLLATAKSPAMLYFLDNYLSADPAAVARQEALKNFRRARYQGAFAGGSMPTPGTFPGPATSGPVPAPNGAPKKPDRGLNENYGREVMELHTVGVDAGYTQQEGIQMAECLTGWTIHEPRKDPQFFFDEKIHDQAKKVVMGRAFNYHGEKDGEEALKMLAGQPATARFISTELARHFVSDNPPAPLVARMAKSFTASNGAVRTVLRTMIYSPEFCSKDAYRSKVKTPFELVASTSRARNAESTITLPLTQWVGRMGEPLYLCQPPTGYSDTAETWVKSGGLLNRLNFALACPGN